MLNNDGIEVFVTTFTDSKLLAQAPPRLNQRLISEAKLEGALEFVVAPAPSTPSTMDRYLIILNMYT